MQRPGSPARDHLYSAHLGNTPFELRYWEDDTHLQTDYWLSLTVDSDNTSVNYLIGQMGYVFLVMNYGLLTFCFNTEQL